MQGLQNMGVAFESLGCADQKVPDQIIVRLCFCMRSLR